MRYALVLCAAALAAAPALADDNQAEADKKPAAKGEVPEVLQFKMKNIKGEEVDLADYRGKVVMIVNTASQCGYTPQYEALQKLHEKYADQGLAVLGFPANEYGGQEPGSNVEIANFCKENYGVDFDMFAKVVVNGPKTCALYKYLTSEETNPKHGGPVAWNFEKFIISRDGDIVGRYKSAIKPDSPQVIKKIETELEKKAS